MICKSLDVYLFSFFFQLRRRFKFVFASQHNSIVESCFRNSVNGDCKLLSNMFPHTVQRCSKNSQGRKLQRKRLLRSSHQNGPLFKLKNTTYKREKREDTFILFKTSKWVTFQRTYQQQHFVIFVKDYGLFPVSIGGHISSRVCHFSQMQQ